MAAARPAVWLVLLAAAAVSSPQSGVHCATTSERTSTRSRGSSGSSGFSSGSFSGRASSGAADRGDGGGGGGGSGRSGGMLLGGSAKDSSASSGGGLLLGGGKSMILGGASASRASSRSDSSSNDDSDSDSDSGSSSSSSSSALKATIKAAASSPPAAKKVKTTVNVGTGGGADDSDSGVTDSSGTATASGDPQFAGWNGKTWFFNGEAGATYNIISSRNYQLAARMKQHIHPGWTHNGTDMDGIGFQYRDYRVVVELLRAKKGKTTLVTDEIAVYINGKALKQKRFGTHVQRRSYRFSDGTAVELIWNLFKIGVGNTVSINTEMLQTDIYVTPHGTTEGDGYAVDAYLNFNLTLKAPPKGNVMTGAMGDTYTHFRSGEAVFSNPNTTYGKNGPSPTDWSPPHKESEYQVADYFDTKYPLNMFGVQPLIRERESLEVDEAVPLARPVPVVSHPARLRKLIELPGRR